MDRISQILVTLLINSVFQVTIIAALAWLCSTALRRVAASYRYVLWVAALVLSSLLPLWSVQSLIVPTHDRNVQAIVVATEHGMNGQTQRLPLDFWSGLAPSHETKLLFPVAITITLAGLYAIFLLHRLVSLAFAWRQTRRLCAAALNVPKSPSLRALVERYAKAFDLNRIPEVYELDGIGPLTIGARHPVVFMPAGSIETASESDLQAAVCHELAHILRGDFQTNALCEMISLAVSFHPALWFIKSRIKQTRELACDDLAAEKLSTPAQYANALVRIAQSLTGNSRKISSSLAQGLFETQNLESRVNNLLEKRHRLNRTLAQVLTLGMIAGLMGATIGASGFVVQITSKQKPLAFLNASGTQATENPASTPIRIGQITFTQTTKSIDEAEIEAFTKEIENTTGLREPWLPEVSQKIRGFWQNRGYFKVVVDANSKLISTSSDGQIFSVVATVNPGALYRLKKLTFTGATVFSQRELEAMFLLHPGDTFSREKVATGMDKVRNAYLAKGYKDWTCVPQTLIDESDHSIALGIAIKEK